MNMDQVIPLSGSKGALVAHTRLDEGLLPGAEDQQQQTGLFYHSGQSGRKHLLEAETLASVPIELYRSDFDRLAGPRRRRWQSSAFYCGCWIGTQRIESRRLGWLMNDEAIEFRRMVARRMRLLGMVNDPDTSVHLEFAQRLSPHSVTALNREPERHTRYEVAIRLADDESVCLIADEDNMLQKSTSARVSVRPAGSRGGRCMNMIVRDSDVVQLSGPPAFSFGEKVRASSTIRNDGTLRGKEIGDIPAKKGDVGYVVSIGTFLQKFYIYGVEFLESGYRVDMGRKELDPVDEGVDDLPLPEVAVS